MFIYTDFGLVVKYSRFKSSLILRHIDKVKWVSVSWKLNFVV